MACGDCKTGKILVLYNSATIPMATENDWCTLIEQSVLIKQTADCSNRVEICTMIFSVNQALALITLAISVW